MPTDKATTPQPISRQAQGTTGSPPTADKLYQVLIDTRNLEIRLFWERSNYFLVLNIGIAFGFFNLEAPRYRWVFFVLGILASWLWYRVCLGGKFWQTRWERRLSVFESAILPDLQFFSADDKTLEKEVEDGLGKPTGLKKWIYEGLHQKRPSVSFSMILLSLFFFWRGSWLL